jgi:hypothetical protein
MDFIHDENENVLHFRFCWSISTALYNKNDRQKRRTFSSVLHNNPLSDENALRYWVTFECWMSQ